MSDAVGGLLRGFNNGLSSGLDFYKTIQGEARANRQEQLQAQRYATEDSRWERNWDRQASQDQAAAARDARDFEWGQDKFELEQKRLQAAADATARYRSAQLANSDRKYNLDVTKHNAKQRETSQKEWKGKLEDGLKRFSGALADNPESAMDMYASDAVIRVGVNKQIANANGMSMDDELAASLYTIPRQDGSYMVAKHTDKGWEPFDADPNSDGTQSMVVPADVFVRSFGGTDAADAAAAKNAEAGARGQVATLANSQFAGNNAEILAKAAGAEQQLAAAEQELKTLSSIPAYITGTDYRGVKTTRPNPELAAMVPGGPEAVAKRKAELQAQIEQSQGYVGGMLERQDAAKGQARATLSSGLNAVAKTTQNMKPEEVPAALSNTVEQLRMGNTPSAEQLGLAPDAALDVGMKETSTMRGAIEGMISKARPSDKDDIKANEAKMVGSIMAAAEKNGGLKQWLATPSGQGLTLNIAAEMHTRGIDYGAGYLAKVASLQRDGASVEAGLDALQSDVVQSLNAKDREPIALLASEIIGTRTDDPEAAIKYAIDDYYAGKRPKTLSGQ